MKSVWWSEQQICENKYDKTGMLAAEVMTALQGQTLIRSYAYDSVGWATRIEDDYFCQSIGYRPENGRVDTMQVQIKQAPDGFAQTLNTSCTYDSFGRITKVELAQFPQHGLGAVTTLQYDANSNLLSGDGTKYEYVHGSNQLAQGQDISYQYNAKGACIKREKNGTSVELAYDKVINCVLTVQDAAGKSVYHQGADGVAACETEDGITRYLQDNKGRLFAKIDSNGTVCFCIYGANGPLAQARNGAVYFMLKDYQSSVRAVWDGEKLCAAWHYTPLGQIIEGAYETDVVLGLIPFRFAGQLLAGHGLYRTKYRFYDPEIGRFLSVDPEHQYNSPYLFGNCDWINYCDPDGAFSWGNFFASLATIAVGLVIAGIGVGISVISGGAAVPILAVLNGAMMAGVGFAMSVYGVTSLFENEYDIGECMIYCASGAVMGALLSGIGAALPAGLTGWTAILADVAVGTVIGAVDGVVTNGCINAYHNRNFADGWLENMIIGGVLGGIFGGISGVGRAYQNQRLIRHQPTYTTSRIYVNYHGQFRGTGLGHASMGLQNSEGSITGAELGLYHPSLKHCGQKTGILYYSETGEYQLKLLTKRGKIRTASIPVREEVFRAISENMREIDEYGMYCYLINDCTAYVSSMLAEGGFTAPLWARTPYTLYLWANLLR